ncbi:MAG: hypothetical protein ACK4RK_21035 [Gemmataceae bacterium]
MDAGSRSVLIDEGNFVGWLIARIFAALLVREFGESAFQTHRPRFPQHPASARSAEEVCA